MVKETTKPKMNADISKALDVLRKSFGKESAMTFTEINKTSCEVVSTGSLAIDIASGIGGLPYGRIVEIFGPESSGKSTICLQTCAQAQKAGKRVCYIDVEHALDPNYMKALGCDLDNMIICQPTNGEEAFNIAIKLAQDKLIDVIVLDSVAAMLTKSEIEGEVGDMFIGKQAKLMSEGFKKLTPLAYSANCLVMAVNQIRQKIGIMFGSPETTSGGVALKFYASMRLRISRTEKPITEGELAIGNDTKVKFIKNKLAAPFRTAEFKIYYNQGVSIVSEILDYAVKFDLIKKSGSWYSYNDEKIGQGEVKTMSWLKEHKDIQNILLDQIRDKILNENVEAEVDEDENIIGGVFKEDNLTQSNEDANE